MYSITEEEKNNWGWYISKFSGKMHLKNYLYAKVWIAENLVGTVSSWMRPLGAASEYARSTLDVYPDSKKRVKGRQRGGGEREGDDERPAS